MVRARPGQVAPGAQQRADEHQRAKARVRADAER